MTKNHLKARSAPRTWNIARKEQKFTTRPNPGSQKTEHTLPLALVLRAMNVGTTKKELNHVLRTTNVLVNGKRRWDLRFGVGFMDVIALPEAKQYAVLSMDNHGRLAVVETTEKLANAKHAQVRTNTMVPGGKLQLALTDGRTILVDAKDAKNYPRGASVVVDLTKGAVTSVHTLAEKAPVIITSGKHRGSRGTIETMDDEFVSVTTEHGTMRTKRVYAFALTNAAAGGTQ